MLTAATGRRPTSVDKIVWRWRRHRAARARDAGDANETGGVWDFIELDGRVRLSQRRRRLGAAALSKGKIHAWEFPSFRNASREYIRNSMDLDGLEARARFPQSCAAEIREQESGGQGE
jgi:hypothetical protein